MSWTRCHVYCILDTMTLIEVLLLLLMLKKSIYTNNLQNMNKKTKTMMRKQDAMLMTMIVTMMNLKERKMACA